MSVPNPNPGAERSRPEAPRFDRPSHPLLASVLLMLGVVVFLVVISVVAVR
jgi:hypothetical protein